MRVYFLSKRFFVSFSKVVISLGLVTYLFIKLGLTNVLYQIQTANWSWFVIGLISFTISNLLGSFQWHQLLRMRGVSLSFQQVVSYYFVGLFFNNFLMGYVGGDAIRIYDVTRHSGQNEAAVSSVFFDRFIGFAILTSMALCAALYWSQFMQSNGVLIIIGLVFLGWVLLFIMLFNHPLVRGISILFEKLLPGKWHLKLREIYLGINNFKHHKKQLLFIVMISMITQFIRILVHYTAARAVGVLSILFISSFLCRLSPCWPACPFPLAVLAFAKVVAWHCLHLYGVSTQILWHLNFWPFLSASLPHCPGDSCL